MSDDTVIRTEGLTKHYGDVRALEDLHLSVQRGEVFGFLGSNGAGKSTTIRTLMGFLKPTSGRASMLGLDIREGTLEIRRHVGYVPGDLAMYPKMTGLELIIYFANLRGGVDMNYVHQLADRLNSDLSRRIGEYSGGNRQKVGLIQAFMHRPRLLVLDEPNSGLDPLVQQEFHRMIDEVRAEGRTVFLSSHTLSEVERVADRVGIIRHGQLIVVERVDALKRKAIRRIDFDFGTDVPDDIFDGVEGVRGFQVDGSHARVSYEGSVNAILQAAIRHEVINLNSREADLEEIFLTYYRDERPATAGPRETVDAG